MILFALFIGVAPTPRAVPGMKQAPNKYFWVSENKCFYKSKAPYKYIIMWTLKSENFPEKNFKNICHFISRIFQANISPESSF